MNTILAPATVGIVGVGKMGIVITERLIAAGYGVNGYRRGSLESFSAVGGVAKPTALDVALGSDPVILLVPNETALFDVMSEISSSLRPGQVVLCLATHSVHTKKAAAEIAHRTGAILLDGEISGTPDMLRAGQASVMIAGDSEAVGRVRPVLDAFARSTTELSAFGDAVKMKLVTNYLVAVHTLAAAEALQFGRRLGLDPRKVIEVVQGSAGGSTMLAVRGPMMVERRYPNSSIQGFMQYFKLLREALSENHESTGPLFELTERLYQRSIEIGCGNLGLSGIHESLDSLFENDANTVSVL